MEQYYKSMLIFMHTHPHLKKCVLFINKQFTRIIYILYPLSLLYVTLFKQSVLLPCLLRPLVAFTLVTFIRKAINRPRPYESMDINPLIQHKKGQSCPSRHALSSMIIGLTFFLIYPTLGIIGVILSLCIGIGRILAGVHYISDVFLAYALALFFFFI